MQWQKSESSTRPLETEPTGAGKFFIRRNINQVTRTYDDKEYVAFEYEEAIATEGELAEYKQEQLLSKIEALTKIVEEMQRGK